MGMGYPQPNIWLILRGPCAGRCGAEPVVVVCLLYLRTAGELVQPQVCCQGERMRDSCQGRCQAQRDAGRSSTDCHGEDTGVLIDGGKGGVCTYKGLFG